MKWKRTRLTGSFIRVLDSLPHIPLESLVLFVILRTLTRYRHERPASKGVIAKSKEVREGTSDEETSAKGVKGRPERKKTQLMDLEKNAWMTGSPGRMDGFVRDPLQERMSAILQQISGKKRIRCSQGKREDARYTWKVLNRPPREQTQKTKWKMLRVCTAWLQQHKEDMKMEIFWVRIEVNKRRLAAEGCLFYLLISSSTSFCPPPTQLNRRSLKSWESQWFLSCSRDSRWNEERNSCPSIFCLLLLLFLSCVLSSFNSPADPSVMSLLLPYFVEPPHHRLGGVLWSGWKLDMQESEWRNGMTERHARTSFFLDAKQQAWIQDDIPWETFPGALFRASTSVQYYAGTGFLLSLSCIIISCWPLEFTLLLKTRQIQGKRISKELKLFALLWLLTATNVTLDDDSPGSKQRMAWLLLRRIDQRRRGIQ